MTELVLSWSRLGVGSVLSTINESWKKLGLTLPKGEVLIIGLALVFAQICDGVLTGIGISQFGTSAEGNLFIRFFMERWGYVPALLGLKLFAILIVGVLCLVSSAVPWLKTAMKALIFIYLGGAILPWTYVLTRTYLYTLS